MARLRDMAKGAINKVANMIDPGKSKLPEQDKSTNDTEKTMMLRGVLDKYIAGKTAHDTRIIEDDRWYRAQHWDLLREQAGKAKNAAEPEPTSRYMFNTIANSHGDLMDAFPEPVFTEREESDKPEAENLSKVTKVILERNKYRRTYSNGAWYKVKSGTSCYHTHWDTTLEGGLGDIRVDKIDILRLYWEPGIEDIQDSPHVFALSLADAAILKQQYPILRDEALTGNNVQLKLFNETDRSAIEDKTTVVDHYWKEAKPPFLQPIMHMEKIVGRIVVDDTRNKRPQGMYDHQKYPFVFDTLFPEEHSLLGFGLVDIIRSPQLYVDKLGAIITKNALVSGKQRILYKEGQIDPNDLADLSKEFIPCKGSLREGEDYAILQGKPLGGDIIQYRKDLIDELKETSGTNDFNRGSSGGGVTAASAIMALQEAGNKLARANVAGTYDAFTEVCYQVMELIAQFYDEPRKFRITNEQGKAEYIAYSNTALKEQPIVTGNAAVDNPVAPEKPQTRKPIFDIIVHAEKSTPFAALASNEIAKELFDKGFFDPERAPSALTALELMSFEGKDRIKKLIQAKYDEAMAMQNATNQANMAVGQNQDLLMQAAEYIKQLTGKDILAGANIGAQKQPQSGQPQAGGAIQ